MAKVVPSASALEPLAPDAVADAAKFLRHALTLGGDFPDRSSVLGELAKIASGGVAAVAAEQGHQLRNAFDAAARQVNVDGVVNALSPQELCVFRASLQSVAESLTADAAGQLAALQTTIESSIHRIASTTGRQDLAVALHGDAAQLRSLAMSGLDAKSDVQQVGKALIEIVSKQGVALSSDAHEALRRMAQWAVPAPAWIVTELANANALTSCAAHCTKDELVQLRNAMGRAASSGTAVELMSLWAFVHSSISNVVPMETLGALVADAVDATEPIRDAVVSETQAVGRLLLQALTASMGLASGLSVELKDAIKGMAEHGVPLPTAAHLRDELQANAALIAEALPADKLVQLEAHIRSVTTTEWGDVHAFAGQLKQAVANLPPMPAVLVGAVKQAGVDLVYNNAFSAALLNCGLDAKLDKLFAQSRENVQETMAALAHGFAMSSGWLVSLLATMPPLLRVEILRDFCQTISLFFSNLYGAFLEHKDAPAIRGAILFFQNAFNIVSADFTALRSDKRELLIDIGFVVLLALIVVAYAAYVWFAFSGRHLHNRADEIRHGHEATTWAALAQKQQMRLRVFTVVITLCLSMYLPLTRVCLEILAATIAQSQASHADVSELLSPSTLAIMQRYGDISAVWLALRIGAVFLVLTFTVPLPFLLIRAISENKPTGSPENPLVTYDLDGEQVPFDDKVYARLVASDPSQLRCPYRSLYAGFEMKWSHYKVLQLGFKIGLIAPLVLTRQRGIRSIITSIVYSLIVGFTSYGTPFNDPLNNIMEVSGKIAALVTCVGGVLLAFLSANDRVVVVVGVVVNVVNAVNLVVMVGIMLIGMKKTRIWIKNRLGTLTFSDTVRDIQDAPAASVIPNWDLEKEAKHRIWHHFWQSVLLALPDNKDIVQRLASLQQAVTESGAENVKCHWQGQANEYVASMRMTARRLLEGVDVFWNDASGARDGFLDSQSCFGKMYIRPYPFHCVVIYDDSQDESIIRDDKFPAFFFLNFSPEIMARRLLRQQLRALSNAQVQIYFPFAREEAVTVEDGTETTTTTNAEGKTETQTRTRYTSVSFTCYYTTGVIHIGANSTQHEMAAGFKLTMTYADGHGDAVAPHTGQVHHQQNRVAVMGPDHVGLTPKMQESEQLRVIFQQTQDRWQPGIIQLQQQHSQYRLQLIEQHAAANRVLGDGFWFFVFNNSHLPRHSLHRYLWAEETSPALRSLPETHAVALDFLYHRMGFVHSHPACKLWFVFWDDVFARNSEMRRLKPFTNELNPASTASIAYSVQNRDALVQWLKGRNLLGHPFSWRTVLSGRRCLFHERILQLLYERIQQLVDTNAHQ